MHDTPSVFERPIALKKIGDCSPCASVHRFEDVEDTKKKIFFSSVICSLKNSDGMLIVKMLFYRYGAGIIYSRHNIFRKI